MTKKERIELLIQAYTDDIESYDLLEKDFRKKISELQDTIRELRGRRVYAKNEIKALRLILTDPEGPWTPGVESHEERRRQKRGWSTPAVLESG